MDFLSRLRRGLAKTRESLAARMQDAVVFARADDSALEQIEEALIACDVGVRASAAIVAEVKLRVRSGRAATPGGVASILKEVLLEELSAHEGSINLRPGLAVVMVVGVNGVGKTTTIAKIAARLKSTGRRVILAAADTFRAAAMEQLEVWADRAGVDLVKHREGGDPAAVAYDAVQAAKSRGLDTVIVDTAGRLHTRSNLMEELKKVRRVLGKAAEGAPHETLLVLDATTGQNAVEQARVFKDSVGVTGIVLTKLDGTARGGVIVPVARETGLPVKYIGVGEGMDDLREFSAADFVEALLGP